MLAAISVVIRSAGIRCHNSNIGGRPGSVNAPLTERWAGMLFVTTGHERPWPRVPCYGHEFAGACGFVDNAARMSDCGICISLCDCRCAP